MEAAGYLLMSIGEVRDVHVFCTVVEQAANAPSRFAEQQRTWKPVELELGWARVLTNSLRRNIQLISDRKALNWWSNLPVGEWAFFYTSIVAELIPDFDYFALRPCDHFQPDKSIRFLDRDFPVLSKQMWDWMQQSIAEEFRTYNSRMFELFLAPKLALMARKFDKLASGN